MGKRIPTDETRYPYVAGSRGVETSDQAAESITPALRKLRKLAYDAVASAGPDGLTSTECADKVGLDRWSVQPRFTELKLLGLIIDSGLRRRNPSGRNAIAWVVTGGTR